MQFNKVCIESVAYVQPPKAFTTDELEERLSPLYERLKLPKGRLELMTGIQSRHFWEHEIRPSEASAEAGEKVLAKSKFGKDEIDLLIHSSVCRDCMEPATAAFVHGLLELSPNAQVLDVSNACLGFANAMSLAAGLIESGQIKRALIVSGENGKPLLENTIGRLLEEKHTRKTIKPLFANLTIGAGAAAAVLCHEDCMETPHGYLRNAVVQADSEANKLCMGGTASNGNGLEMATNAEALLKAGIKLAKNVWKQFCDEIKWTDKQVTRYICHQVGKTHQTQLFDALKLDKAKDFVTYPFLGNVGSVSLPATLAHAVEQGVVKSGDKLALLGIGSGLNCMMLGVEW
jgi:3-oxoacyl-[acyl-carrier-protein] synthase-3